MKPGRNDPCPCGSGRKYKTCCGAVSNLKAAPATAPANDTPEAANVPRARHVKALDNELATRLLRFARARFGRDWIGLALDAYTDGAHRTIEDAELQLAIPWAMFHCLLPEDDLALAEEFRAEKARHLSTELREVLDAQLDAWLGVWEVRRLDNGVGVLASDLLTGEERFVHDVSLSRSADLRVSILGFVVDSGVSFFGAVHPRALEPRYSDNFVREARRMCRVRTRPVNKDRLRDPTLQLDLIHLWKTMVEPQNEARPDPRLTNTDGDQLVFLTDHFEIAASDSSAVVARLASFPGAQEPEEGEPGKAETVIVVTKPGNRTMKSWDNTVIGRIVIAGRRMRVESNSVRRGDELRDALNTHLGDLVRYRLRDETSQQAMFQIAHESRDKSAKASASPQTPELIAMARDLRQRYMVDWLDQEVPALGGLTPREAARSPKSRKSLETLLREFEYHESRHPEDERIDIGEVRAALGMPG
jgi:hypothetical protein